MTVGSPEAIHTLVGRWSREERRRAWASLGFDVAFIAAYGAAFTCAMRQLRSPPQETWLLAAAIASDAVEDVMVALLLRGVAPWLRETFWADVVWWACWVKLAAFYGTFILTVRRDWARVRVSTPS